MAADQTLQALASQAAPLDYPVPGAVELILKSLKCSFDGTGAAGPYVPCVQLLIAGDVEDATYPLGSSVAAGASADVSWFPRAGGGIGVGGAGIRFDTDNEGGWLDITTKNTDPGGAGLQFLDLSGGGMFFDGDSGITLNDRSNNGINLIQESDGGIAALDQGNGGISFTELENGGIYFQNEGTGQLALNNNGSAFLGINSTTTGPIEVHQSGGHEVLLYATASSTNPSPPGNTAIVFMAADGGNNAPSVMAGINDGDSFAVFNLANAAQIWMEVLNTGVTLNNLPSTNPGGSGKLWNNGGVVNIT